MGIPLTASVYHQFSGKEVCRFSIINKYIKLSFHNFYFLKFILFLSRIVVNPGFLAINLGHSKLRFYGGILWFCTFRYWDLGKWYTAR